MVVGREAFIQTLITVNITAIVVRFIHCSINKELNLFLVKPHLE